VDFRSLTFDGVSRHFGRRVALRRVSLTCRVGEIVALLGANGAGKSTLLSIASTLLAPSSGDVLYGDLRPRDGGERLRARIGLLGHDLFLYPELTAAENLEFFGRLYGVAEPARAASASLVEAGLSDRAADVVSTFSRGMRQRLALARVLMPAPRLLLLDEPFTGLDEAAADALRVRLAEARNGGAIVLLATHDLDAIEGLADRACVLTAGRLDELPAGAAPLRQRYRQHVAS
jgi:ABC-type multidrug transport system ATPase subunit